MRIIKNNRGMTLIEVLVAAAILVTSIAAIAVIISRGSQINQEDLMSRRAHQALEKALESEDLLHYQHVLDSADGTWHAISTDTLSDIGGSPILGTVERKMTRKLYDLNGTNIPGVEVVVRITYNGRTETLETVLTDVPLD